MLKINPLLRYGSKAVNRCKDTGNFLSQNSDSINDGLNTTYDVLSNIPIGKDLVQVARRTPNIAPEFEEKYSNMVNSVVNKHLDKLELTANLTEQEKKEFINNLQGDKNSFVTMALGGKPAVIISGKNEFIKPTENYDVLRRELEIPVKNKMVKVDNTIILNKKLTKQTIEENKELYINRMNLDEDSSVEEIYSELTGENSFLKRNEKHDLIGITLGYSPINSVIYQLDQTIPDNLETRKELNSYKKALLNQLMKDESPYKDFDFGFKREVASNIRDIGKEKEPFNTNWSTFGYACRNIVPDEEHSQKLIRNILNTYQKSKTI